MRETIARLIEPQMWMLTDYAESIGLEVTGFTEDSLELADQILGVVGDQIKNEYRRVVDSYNPDQALAWNDALNRVFQVLGGKP